MNILLTRPHEDSLVLKQIIEANSNHKCFIHPIIDIEIIDKKIEIPFNSYVVITSVNSIRALAKNTKIRDYKIITVGQQSASEAEKLGFRNICSAVTSRFQNASEQNLINFILQNIDKGEEIYHISADITKGGLQKRLKENGYKYNRIILYYSNPLELNQQLKDDITNFKYQSIAFFSPRTAAIFSQNIYKNSLQFFLHEITAYCFSQNVVLGLQGLNLKKIFIPEMTNTENFINMLCEN